MLSFKQNSICYLDFKLHLIFIFFNTHDLQLLGDPYCQFLKLTISLWVFSVSSSSLSAVINLNQLSTYNRGALSVWISTFI